ncbi:G-protein coupled receptor G4 [Collichthys lucidus]|uniref:G-protein coupled receptor G4 n=1 Tax=Collichthys lucidus TaxID=240159 RepID=A0A4U5UCL2_COLLU|nr:G-protein coupled receptor G4 [Collichthys lucidus]
MLQPGIVVPALEELSVCMILRLRFGTEWTGFVYKAPGQSHIELGIRGTSTHLVQLTPNGTLTLGVSHYVNSNGVVEPETGNNLLGEISLFRMWAREWSAEELRGHRCADGDVLVSIFPRDISVLDVSILSPSFSCEVYVNVDPASDVEVVQANITALLSLTFSNDFLNLTSDPNSISVLPVGLYALDEPPTTVGTAVTSETAPTQSVPGRPANMSTTREPLDLNETAVEHDTFFRVNITLSMTGSPSEPQDIIEKWEYSKNSAAEVKTFIYAALMSEYKNGSITVKTTDVAMKQIMPHNCLEETTSTIYGQYIWPEAFPQVNQEMGCKKPKSARAYRLCKLDIETDKTSWAHPNMANCKPLVTISYLNNITVTTDNAADVVDTIQELVDVQLGTSKELSATDLDTVVEKLEEVVNISSIKPAVGANIVNIVADVLLSKTDVTPVTNIVLNLTERMADKMDFQDESVSLTAPLLALSAINVDPDEFNGFTFGVSSVSSDLNPKIFLDPNFLSEPLPDTDATISLPSELHDLFIPGQRNKTRVQFNFYGTQKLFQDPLITNTTQSSWKLNSFIVSASINNSNVSNLKDRVVVTLNHQTPKRDISKDPISETDSQIMTVISYLGCGISSIFLGITLLTYIAFEKLRQDHPSKILMNLSAALLGLSMLYLLDSWLSSFSNYGLCIATAAMLHYFLLASFTWMGLEAVHMYLALVKVFNVYIPSYILKFCAAGWGIPLVIVSLVLIVDKDAYGNVVPGEDVSVHQSTDPFCWLQNDVFFYVTVMTFVLLILLCNISVFIVVLIQIRHMKANKRSTYNCSALHDLRAVASLTVLLGLTWAMGFLSFGPGRVVMMYLFCISNSLQDWSRTMTGGDHRKKNNLVNSDSVASDSTSAVRKVSDSSTGSAPNHHQRA